MSFKIYPVTQTELLCTDYTVTVNGVKADLNSARVSAVPFNRRWPGYQRDISQTELVNFLSLATDEPLTIAVTPNLPFDEEKVVVRPQSLGIKPECRDGKITFTLPGASYCTVEPFGRNHALHIFADPVKDYGIDIHDENVLYFGPGEHAADMIEMKSNQTLFLDEGCVLHAHIHAIDCDNIRILGRGILDNSRKKEQILFEVHEESTHAAVRNAVRTRPIQLEYCQNIEIDGITIRDSMVYNIHPRCCRGLHINNVKLIGNWRYNSDGIDMHNCEDVLIERCFIRTFDDCLCVKGMDCFYEGDLDKAVYEATHRNGQVYEDFKNITARNCTLWNDWGKCLEIGAETRAEKIYNVVFENCDILHATGPVLDCCNTDYADIFDVTYRNINVEFEDTVPKPVLQRADAQIYENPDPDYAPELLKVYIQYHYEYSAGGTRRGKCHDIKFQNIHLYARQKPRLSFTGHDEDHKVENITVENLYWNGKLLTSEDEVQLKTNEFTENIVFTNSFAQMDKNTVDATVQLKPSGAVRFYNPEGKGKRVMFVGNSMTLHGIKEDIGWHGEWGMAASSAEKDYVHCLMRSIEEITEDPAFCTCQVSMWERAYKDGREYFPRYENAMVFRPDILVMRYIENCPKADFDPEVFKTESKLLLGKLCSAHTRVILTTGFWRHPGDDAIRELAKELDLPLVELGDLGERDDMKAIGLFEHKGVANHPGDLGMQTMSDRIFEVLKNYL